MTTIYNNIPVPPSKRGQRPSKYPYDKLEVGGSFFVVPNEGEAIEKVERRLYSTALNWRKRTQSTELQFRVAIDTHPDLLVPAVGVWRTA